LENWRRRGSGVKVVRLYDCWSIIWESDLDRTEEDLRILVEREDVSEERWSRRSERDLPQVVSALEREWATDRPRPW
jgi:hypothetical protein